MNCLYPREAEELRAAVAASVVLPTALVSVCDELQIPHYTFHAHRVTGDSTPHQKHGPKPLAPTATCSPPSANCQPIRPSWAARYGGDTPTLRPPASQQGVDSLDG